jgi:hypothetical protein
MPEMIPSITSISVTPSETARMLMTVRVGRDRRFAVVSRSIQNPVLVASGNSSYNIPTGETAVLSSKGINIYRCGAMKASKNA